MQLQAAFFASRLSRSISEEQDIELANTYFWSDSAIVLTWIWSDAQNYKTLVSHRLAEIDESTNVSQ